MIRHNLLYKLVALAVALVLWIYVNSERNPQASKALRVPMEARNVPEGYVAEPVLREVTVSIRGPKTVVEAIRKDDVSAWVDLRGVRPRSKISEATLEVKARVAGVADGDLGVTTAPEHLSTKIEAVTGRQFPVQVSPMPAAPPDFSYAEPVLTPPVVKVLGRASRVAAVKAVVVSPRSALGGGPVTGTFKVSPIDARGDLVEGVAVSPTHVRLTIQLVEMPATKSVLVSANVTGEPKFPARVSRVSVTPSSVGLSGKPTALVGVSTVSTEPVSIDDATETVTRDVAVRVPSGLKLVGRRTVRVTVHIVTP